MRSAQQQLIPEQTTCTWCGLRPAICDTHGPTCEVCALDPEARVTAYLEQLQRVCERR